MRKLLLLLLPMILSAFINGIIMNNMTTFITTTCKSSCCTCTAAAATWFSELVKTPLSSNNCNNVISLILKKNGLRNQGECMLSVLLSVLNKNPL